MPFRTNADVLRLTDHSFEVGDTQGENRERVRNTLKNPEENPEKFGLNSLRIESFTPIPRETALSHFDENGNLRESDFEDMKISLYDENKAADEVPEIEGLARKMLIRKANMGYNIHCGSGETDVLTDIQNTKLVPLNEETLVRLINEINPDLLDKGVFISGDAASLHLDELLEEQPMGEVLNVAYAKRTKEGGIIVSDSGYEMRGGRAGKDEVTVTAKQPNAADAILEQGAVYERATKEDAPIVVELEGEITSQKIQTLAEQLGITGPYSIHVIVKEGHTDTRAISTMPTKNMEIGEVVSKHMASPQIDGTAVGTGLHSETPYTKNPHIHLVGKEKGGHFVSTKGKMLVAFHPLKTMIYGTYDATRENTDV